MNNPTNENEKTPKNTRWAKRAIIMSIGVLAIGGGILAATTLSNNSEDELQVNAAQTEILTEEENNATENNEKASISSAENTTEASSEETVYSISKEPAEVTSEEPAEVTSEESAEIVADENAAPSNKVEKKGIATAEVKSVTKNDRGMVIKVDFEFDDISKFDPLKETFDTLVKDGCQVTREGDAFDNYENVDLDLWFDDTQMVSWINNYSIEGNTLSVEIMINDKFTKDLLEDKDPYYSVGIYNMETGEEIPGDESRTNMNTYLASIPDPTTCTISFDFFLGDDLGGTYSFTTKMN